MIDRTEPVLALDMDGVLLQSLWAKHGALMRIFSESQRAELESLSLSLSGVPRAEKISWLLNCANARSPTDREIERALVAYKQELSRHSQPAVAAGVVDVLSARHGPMYVCSSAPSNEVARHIQRAGLTAFFRTVFGAPITKREALQRIIDLHPGTPLVFLGDASADRIAALNAGAAFVAVTAESDQFGSDVTPKLATSTSREECKEAIATALRHFVA